MKKAAVVSLLVLTVAIFFSCNKPSDSRFSVKHMNDLKVPDNFNWQTGFNVRFVIHKSLSGVVKITSEDGGVIYHKGYFNGLTSEYVATVYIPAYVSRVLVNGEIVEITGTETDVVLHDEKGSFKMEKASPPGDARIAYWRFNENGGTTVTDSQGDNDGTVTGADWVTGINKSALDFNGVNGEVEIPLTDELNITGDKISLAVWFKKESADDDGTFIFSRIKYILRIDNHGKITFAVYTPGWHAVTIPWNKRIIDTDWHQLVATYDGQKIKIFVDTQLLAENSVSGNLQSSPSPVYIGSEHPLNYFAGVIDEVAVYDKALSAAEILQLYSGTPDPDTGNDYLISSWNMDENGGNTLYDGVGNNNGTVFGAQWDAGVSGSSLKFDGQNDYVIVPNASNLNPTDAITLMAWAKTKENKTCKIAEKGGWDGHSVLQDKWNGWTGQIRLDNNTTYTVKWGNGIPVIDEWYHIAMTFDGSVLKLYVNGQLSGTKSISGKLHVNNRDFAIGSNNGSQKFFHGNIDDVRIYSQALSQTEIQAIYKDSDNSSTSDADGDGVGDADDDYPHDPERTFNNFLPATGFGSLAFEDLWPGKGDYDFNDLVLDYRFVTVTNANNKISDVQGIFVIRAIGAGQSNGFGFQLANDGISASDITVSGYDLRSNYIQLNDNGTEQGEEKPTIIVFDDANEIMPPSEGFGVNVEPEKTYVNPDTIRISLAFTPDTYSAEDLDIVHFNPFMIVNKTRGKEIHLPDYPPTSLVDAGWFGTMDDNSDPATGRYYKTVNNLPWALNISESFDYLIEKNEITTGYLKFYDWAASSGSSFPDWYKDKTGYRNSSVIYKIPQ